MLRSTFIFAIVSLAASVTAQDIVNGQIFTPGLAVVNAPQPNTPLGGDTLHISLDVTYNGKLQLPPYNPNSPTAIHNITIFLSSYATGKNFTVSNGTASGNDASLGDIMLQEGGSTVKHINWKWPNCLIGDGSPTSADSARGLYNISIRQNFRLDGTERYTIFDLPIRVTNSIPETFSRPECDSLNNPLLTDQQLRASASDFTLLPGSAIDTGNNNNGNGNGNSNGNGNGNGNNGSGDGALAGLDGLDGLGDLDGLGGLDGLGNLPSQQNGNVAGGNNGISSAGHLDRRAGAYWVLAAVLGVYFAL